MHLLYILQLTPIEAQTDKKSYYRNTRSFVAGQHRVFAKFVAQAAALLDLLPSDPKKKGRRREKRSSSNTAIYRVEEEEEEEEHETRAFAKARSERERNRQTRVRSKRPVSMERKKERAYLCGYLLEL